MWKRRRISQVWEPACVLNFTVSVSPSQPGPRLLASLLSSPVLILLLLPDPPTPAPVAAVNRPRARSLPLLSVCHASGTSEMLEVE